MDGASWDVGSRFEDYLLDARLGAGGMAITWRARERIGGVGDRFVALKQILPEHAKNPEFRTMFFDEVRIASLIHHRNVCQIYRAGEHQSVLFMAMEYVDGCALSELAERWARRGEPALPPEHALYLVSEVLNGLYAAHTLCDVEGRPLHIVHRDVSPQNVLVSRHGEVKLIDFGIARAASNDSHTRTGAIKGKLLYLCPEQLEGRRPDARGDLFSAGLMLYELLCGLHPFRGDSEMATLFNYATRVIEPPSVVRPELPAALDAVVMTALERAEARRWTSARAMAEACLDALHTLRPGYRAAHFEAFVQAALDPDRPLDDVSLASPLVTASGLEHADTAQMQAIAPRADFTDAPAVAPLPAPSPQPVAEAAPPQPQPVADTTPPSSRRLRTVLIAVAAVALLGGVLTVGYLLGGTSRREPTALSGTAEDAADPSQTLAARTESEAVDPEAQDNLPDEALDDGAAQEEDAPGTTALDADEPDEGDEPDTDGEPLGDDEEDDEAEADESPPGGDPSTSGVTLLVYPDDDEDDDGTGWTVPVDDRPHDVALLEELGLFVRCLTRAEPRARQSLARYLSWVKPRVGPTCKEPHVSYGLYEVYEDAVQLCRAASELAEGTEYLSAQAPRLAEFANAFETLVPLAANAARYYDGERYLRDDCSWGMENHRPLLAAFKATLDSASALRAELLELRAEAEAVRREVLQATPGAELEVQLRATVLLLDTVLAFDADPDATAWVAQVEAFIEATDALRALAWRNPQQVKASEADRALDVLDEVATLASRTASAVAERGAFAGGEVEQLRYAASWLNFHLDGMTLSAPLFSLCL